jgi:prepilin-type N-terminal cleavage/methylation domain-containing protein
MRKGFTLVEILVVAVIIALLASAIFYGYTQFARQGRDSRRALDLSNVQKSLELYYSRNSQYPSGPDYASMSSQLSAAGIGPIPNDPVPGSTYFYGVSVNRQSYTLGATLENSQSAILNNDLDGTVNGVNCDDSASVYCVGSN